METNGATPLAHVMDLLLDAICVVDTQGRFVFVSAACEPIFGYTPDELVGRPMIELVFPEDRARTLAAVDEIVAGEHRPNFENRYVRKDGRIAHIMWTARWSPVDQVRVAVARDVTERKHAESMQAALYAISEAAHAAADLLALFGRIHAILGELMPAREFVVALYDAAHDRLSFPYCADEGPQPPGPFDPDRVDPDVIRSARAVCAGGAADDAAAGWIAVPLRTQNGVIGALVLKRHPAPAGTSGADLDLLSFVSAQVAAAIERKQTETWLRHCARHDALTDLPNRSLIRDRIATALERARRDHSRLALLYLDLDRFKQVNDHLGHAVGDRLLQEVARRLAQCVRESDSIGRIGGDEFVVLLGSVQAPGDAALVAEKIRLALCRPFELAGRQLSISPSIGIARFPEDGDECELLLRRADAAMYEAKQDGGNRIRTAGEGVG